MENISFFLQENSKVLSHGTSPFWVKELVTALVISKEHAKMDGLHILYYINTILKTWIIRRNDLMKPIT
jgi:hypothetical protein